MPSIVDELAVDALAVVHRLLVVAPSSVVCIAPVRVVAEPLPKLAAVVQPSVSGTLLVVVRLADVAAYPVTVDIRISGGQAHPVGHAQPVSLDAEHLLFLLQQTMHSCQQQQRRRTRLVEVVMRAAFVLAVTVVVVEEPLFLGAAQRYVRPRASSYCQKASIQLTILGLLEPRCLSSHR